MLRSGTIFAGMSAVAAMTSLEAQEELFEYALTDQLRKDKKFPVSIQQCFKDCQGIDARLDKKLTYVCSVPFSQ